MSFLCYISHDYDCLGSSETRRTGYNFKCKRCGEQCKEWRPEKGKIRKPIFKKSLYSIFFDPINLKNLFSKKSTNFDSNFIYVDVKIPIVQRYSLQQMPMHLCGSRHSTEFYCTECIEIRKTIRSAAFAVSESPEDFQKTQKSKFSFIFGK